MRITANQLVELAREVESQNTIDWAMLEVNEDEAYQLMALGMLDLYQSLPEKDRDLVLLSVATKLTVENFALNLKLMAK